MELLRTRRQTFAYYATGALAKSLFVMLTIACVAFAAWFNRGAFTPPDIPIISTKTPTVSLRVDDCPDGDFSGFPNDNQCGTKPATPDSCPSGDWTGNYFDGNCGTRPTNPDVCPDGDFSGSPIDGKCGTKPTTPKITTPAVTKPAVTKTTTKTTTTEAKTFTKTVTCDGPVLLNVSASGKGKVSIAISGAASASGSTSATVQGPQGSYRIAVTDTGGNPRMTYTSKGAVCS